MTDVHTPEQRSRNMRAVRGKNTKPEWKVRRACHKLGYRFRLHAKQLPGTPDLVFPKHKIALFVNGCFWHQHNCKFGSVRPKSNAVFWAQKRGRTVERDRQKAEQLEAQGWSVRVIWECETRNPDVLETKILERLPPTWRVELARL